MHVIQGKIHDIHLAEHIYLSVKVVDVGVSLIISDGIGEITPGNIPVIYR